ncbi:glycosyltransferase family 4 protein [Priestia aryabhattai]|nr:glycosyltransferase family 4 protein [Priestia aryabhattai]
MVVQAPTVKGGIAAVVNGYRGSWLEKQSNIIYVESYKDGGKVKKLLKAIRGYFHFLKVLIVSRPDLVHIHSSFGPSFYRKIPFIYIARIARKPIINHCHGADFEEFYLKASQKKKALIKNVYNKCNITIALSNEWKEKLKDIVPDEKIVVIENYSIINKCAMKERMSKKNKKQVLFLGEIGYRKGCYDIPAVIEKVKESVADVQFVLGGSGDIDKIKALIKERKLEENVVFPGWVRGEDKDKLLRESDIFFLPSYNEGMPMSILDAMGYGLPVVSSNVGGIPKIVYNNKNGSIHEPGDINGFASSIINLLTNKSKRVESGKASLEIVQGSYSLEKHLTSLSKLYEGTK